MGSQRTLKSSEAAKRCLSKNHETPLVFLSFGGPEASQERLRKPQKTPKRHLKSSKTPQNIIRKLQIFEKFFDQFWIDFGKASLKPFGPSFVVIE